MLREAIEKILSLAPVTTREIAGRLYSDRALTSVKDPEAAPLTGHTLQGLIDYWAEDDLNDNSGRGYFIHIQDHETVRLISPLFGAFKQREVYFESRAIIPNFQFGSYYNLEDFVVALQSKFIPSDTTRQILSVLGNISDGTVRTATDDGISQTINVKAGITKQATATIENPVTLQPYRTFLEAIQPESSFILRLRPGTGGQMPAVALFEADGGAWKNQAIKNIKAWFRSNLPEIPIIA